jgi:hypothetical protein
MKRAPHQGLPAAALPKNKLKEKGFLNTISKVLHDLLTFNRYQKVKLAEDCYIRILKNKARTLDVSDKLKQQPSVLRSVSHGTCSYTCM